MRPRWLIIGLVASLALNLFLIGAGVGVIALGARMARQQPAPPRPAGALFWATDELPQPARRAMRLMLVGLRDRAKPDTDRSIALRTAAWGALADPNPDVAAINQKLAESRQADIAVRASVEQSIVDYVIHMSPADRATFAAGMRRVLNPAAAPTAATPTNAAVNTARG